MSLKSLWIYGFFPLCLPPPPLIFMYLKNWAAHPIDFPTIWILPIALFTLLLCLHIFWKLVSYWMGFKSSFFGPSLQSAPVHPLSISFQSRSRASLQALRSHFKQWEAGIPSYSCTCYMWLFPSFYTYVTWQSGRGSLTETFAASK